MARIIQRHLRRSGRWFCDTSVHWCAVRTLDRLRRDFNVPLKAQTLWLSLYTTAASDRLPLRVTGDGTPFRYLGRESGYAYWSGDTLLDQVLMGFVGQTVHLQVEYEK